MKYSDYIDYRFNFDSLKNLACDIKKIYTVKSRTKDYIN